MISLAGEDGRTFANGPFTNEGMMEVYLEPVVRFGRVEIPGREILRDFKCRANTPYVIRAKVDIGVGARGLKAAPKRKADGG